MRMRRRERVVDPLPTLDARQTVAAAAGSNLRESVLRSAAGPCRDRRAGVSCSTGRRPHCRDPLARSRPGRRSPRHRSVRRTSARSCSGASVSRSRSSCPVPSREGGEQQPSPRSLDRHRGHDADDHADRRSKQRCTTDLVKVGDPSQEERTSSAVCDSRVCAAAQPLAGIALARMPTTEPPTTGTQPDILREREKPHPMADEAFVSSRARTA